MWATLEFNNVHKLQTKEKQRITDYTTELKKPEHFH